jgi:hypothetical protein
MSTHTRDTTIHHNRSVSASPSRNLAGAGGVLRSLLAAIFLLVGSVGAWGVIITWNGAATGGSWEVNTVPRQNAFPRSMGGEGATDSDGLFAKTRSQGAIL